MAGLKFNKLDEDTKDAILNAELQMYELTDCTEKDVREMFRRQNAGKPLNNRQLRIVLESEEFSNIVYSLSNHPFMDKLMTNAQRKNGSDKDLIIQAFMLIETNQNNDFTSFRSKDINTFVCNNSNHIDSSKSEVLKTAMDKFNESFDQIKIPVTSAPMMLYSGYRVVKNKKSFSKLVDLINKFLSEYDKNEKYKQYVVSGTSSSENVSGRLKVWNEMIKTI